MGKDPVMKHRLLAMALPFAAGLAFVGALAAAGGYPEAAGALLGTGLGIGLLALQLRLDDLGSRTERRQSAHTAAMAGALSANAAAHTRQNARLRRELQHTKTLVEELPSDAVALHRLYAEIAPAGGRLPTLGGWAATPRTILLLTDEIRRAQGVVVMLECGSGASTLMAALQMKASGHLHSKVVSLEADPAFAEQTRASLRELGVEQYATVVDAPIVDVELPDGEVVPWYDLSNLPTLDPVTLLFVDGPIGAIAEQARYPAFPLLAGRLAEDALVVLDDTNRPDEKAIVARWSEDWFAERRLHVVATTGRATVLRAEQAAAPVVPEPEPAAARSGGRPRATAAMALSDEPADQPAGEEPAVDEASAAEAVAEDPTTPNAEAEGSAEGLEEPDVTTDEAEAELAEPAEAAEAEVADPAVADPAEAEAEEPAPVGAEAEAEEPADPVAEPATDEPAAEDEADEQATGEVEADEPADVVPQEPPLTDEAPEQTVRRSRFAPPS